MWSLMRRAPLKSEEDCGRLALLAAEFRGEIFWHRKKCYRVGPRPREIYKPPAFRIEKPKVSGVEMMTTVPFFIPFTTPFCRINIC